MIKTYTETEYKDALYYGMARGIFMGKADLTNMDALFPEAQGDWVSMQNNPEKVEKLANLLKKVND